MAVVAKVVLKKYRKNISNYNSIKKEKNYLSVHLKIVNFKILER